MRDWDAYWHDFCWIAWQQNRTESYLDCGTCGQALTYFKSLNKTLPINPSLECMTTIVPPVYIPVTSPVADVRGGLPPRSANYGCLGKQMTSATM